MTPNAVSISVVIPAYNEQTCIADSLDAVLAFAKTYPALQEVIVVDDGSTDATASAVTAAQARHVASGGSPALRLLRNPCNQGKGATVRNGVLAATGDIVLFTDADLSAPIAEAPRLIEPIAAGDYDMVIGSRAIDRALIGVRQSVFRENAGKVFNVLVRTITRMPIRDTQCGFKAFRRTAVLPIFQMQRIGGFAFDVELLYWAIKGGLRVHEVPVHWNHVAHTQVRLIRDSMRMLLDVLRLRLQAWRTGPRPADHGEPAIPDRRAE